MTEDHPSGARIVAGCFLAAASAPFPAALSLVAIVSPAAGPGTALATLIFGIPIALLHLPLALPIYFLLRRHWRLAWWNSALGGVLVGTLPAAVLLPGWQVIMVGAACGSAGGLVFWAILRTPAARDLEILAETFF